jgi:hypothetical protein
MDGDLRDRPACHPSEAPSTANPGRGGRAAAALSLRVPLLVATAGYLIAVALACVIRSDR